MNLSRTKLYLILILGFINCFCNRNKKPSVEKQYELRVTEQINEQVIFGIDAKLEQMRTYIRKSGNRVADLKMLENSERLVSLRKKYLQDKIKRHLITYTDSILKINQNNSRGFYNYIKLDPISYQEITRLREEVINSNDSLAQAKLFFWGLKAESQFQNVNSSQVGRPFRHLDNLKVLINSEKLILGDSVYIVVTPYSFSDCFDFHYLKPKSSYIIRKGTLEKIDLKKVTIGMQHLYFTIPQKRGKYEFHGKFLIEKSETGYATDTTAYVIYNFEVL